MDYQKRALQTTCTKQRTTNHGQHIAFSEVIEKFFCFYLLSPSVTHCCLLLQFGNFQYLTHASLTGNTCVHLFGKQKKTTVKQAIFLSMTSELATGNTSELAVPPFASHSEVKVIKLRINPYSSL